MGRNTLPTNSGQIIGLATNMLAGLTSLGTTLGITQISPTDFQAMLDAYMGVESSFNAARSAKQTALDGWTAATGALFEWLGVARNVLAGRFGSRWSPEWAQAGWVTPSTSVPKRLEAQLALALSLVDCFTAHPAWQVTSMLVTAAQATVLRNAALTAQQGVLQADLQLVQAGDERTEVSDTLIGMMRALIKILGATIANDDPRWLAFGLNIPATDTTPGQPQGLTATLDATGAILVQCAAVPLATRYRWRMLLMGVQTKYELAASSADPVATIGDVLPGQTVRIIVQAVNGTLQGVASDPVDLTLPPAVAKSAEPKAAAPAERTLVLTGSGGNGNGNGHLVHSR